MDSPGAVVQRMTICTAVMATAALFLPSANDPVNVPKLSVLLLCSLVVLAVGASRVIQSRRLAIPVSPACGAACALLVAFVISTAAAPDTSTAVVGAYGRDSGLLAYLAALVLFIAALYLFGVRHAPALLVTLVLAGGFTAAYGLLQRAGVDAVGWNNPFNPIIASLGNPDFASAYLGIAAPAAACGALRAVWPPPLRAVCGVTAVACLGVAAASAAVQGPVAAVGGLLVLAVAVALGLQQPLRRRVLAVIAAVTVLGVAVLAIGAAGAGPSQRIFSRVSFHARTWYWQAAVTMWRRDPVVGVGLDEYGLHWRRDRPLAAPRALGGDAYSDSAHNVPLQHLAQGGLLLAAAYLFFVIVVAVALVAGLRRLEGDARLVLGGLGGAWVAYQVQSLVSIDQVPLLLLNFVLGGAGVAVAGHAGLRTWRLPGASPPAPTNVGRKRAVVPQARRASSGDRVIQSVIALTALVLGWLCLTPLRANIAARQGDSALHGSNGNAALAHYQQATSLMPGEGVYWTLTGSLYQLAQQSERARAAFERAFRQDGTQVNALRVAAQIAQGAGDIAGARRDYAVALAMDPTNSASILPWAALELSDGDAAVARTRLQQGVHDLPRDGALWATLGDADAAAGDVSGARAAYQRALELQPQQPQALSGLKKLASS